jgi:predicted RNase H-like HicB family nuclease
MAVSAKSKSSKKYPHRPFDPAILRRAEAIADKYQLVIWKEEGYYYGHGVELPNSYGDGKTVAACAADTREAFVATVATLLELGEEPPPPAIEEIRSEQVNVRLTARERLHVEAAAKQKGFRGISDYVRSAALAGYR